MLFLTLSDFLTLSGFETLTGLKINLCLKGVMLIEATDYEVQIFINTVREKSHYDFSDYSITSLKKRVGKVMRENNLNISQLTERIHKDKAFVEEIVKRIYVSTTELFRDPALWISLRNEILTSCTKRNTIRIWHAGCSTGQEVYSMMIILNELDMLERSEIYATDINQDALDKSKRGIYTYNFNTANLKNLDKVIKKGSGENNFIKIPFERYFNLNTEADEICMMPFLTQKPVYKKSDPVKDVNPFHVKFDIIVCRNVIIYFNNELQNNVLSLFHRSLENQGCMILGANEKIADSYSKFFEKKEYYYLKKP